MPPYPSLRATVRSDLLDDGLHGLPRLPQRSRPHARARRALRRAGQPAARRAGPGRRLPHGGRGGAVGRRRRARRRHRRRRRHRALARDRHRRVRDQRRLADRSRRGDRLFAVHRQPLSRRARAGRQPRGRARHRARHGGARGRLLGLRSRDRTGRPALLQGLVPGDDGHRRHARRRRSRARRPHVPPGAARRARPAHRRGTPAAAARRARSTGCGTASPTG